MFDCDRICNSICGPTFIFWVTIRCDCLVACIVGLLILVFVWVFDLGGFGLIRFVGCVFVLWLIGTVDVGCFGLGVYGVVFRLCFVVDY